MAIQTNKDVTEITYNGVNVPLYHKTQTKSTTITSNGTTTITKDADYDGMTSVEITTNVPTPVPSLQDITITENGTYTHAGYDGYDEVVVNVSGGGGRTEAVSKDINFYDYDGFRVDSWTLAELSSKTSLPANPTHDGLTAQGWNWTLAQLQSANRQIDVGQIFTTTDGATHIHVTLDKGRLAPTLGVGQSAANGLIIDWGDGSAQESSGSATGATTPIAKSHTYASAGDYIIKLYPQGSAKLYLYGSTSGCNILYSSESPYVYSSKITEINVGNAVTISANAFYNAYGCEKISIPSSVTLSGTAFSYNWFSALILPSVSTAAGFLRYGSKAKVYALGENIQMQQEAVRGCFSMERFCIPNGTNKISANTFNSAYALGYIEIPPSVIQIAANSFTYSLGLGAIKFLSSSPPSALASSSFTGLPTYCTIYVPSGSLSAYTSAANYPSSSTYTYVEY